MTYRERFALMCSCGLLIFVFWLNHVSAQESVFVLRNEIIDGKSLNEYSNIWWQWAKSMPNRESPLIDKVGIKCAVNQKGSVWFLGGGYGTSKISRSCKIPSDKFIFFPVINMVYYPPEIDATTCESVKKGAALNNDLLTAFFVEVDGERSINPALHRHSSEECFNLFALIPERFNAPIIYPSATDGYWAMLHPLPVGKHSIRFRAEYNNPNNRYGLMVQDIEYVIDVTEP